MRYLLINPAWNFRGSIYFGCREPHLPLEYGYARQILEAGGHEVLLLDCHLLDIAASNLQILTRDFKPDFTVISTAPSYLFWRCPPPELRIPRETVRIVRRHGGTVVAVGPHGSVTPGAVSAKLKADLVILGEFEEVLPRLAQGDFDSKGWLFSNGSCSTKTPFISDMDNLPPLCWPADILMRHRHHHHRFNTVPAGPGAEVESSRGCPFSCNFCAKEHFRSKYRKRTNSTVLKEIEDLRAKGVEYVYFIDEIFMPDKDLLKGIEDFQIKFGVQLRIDLWDREMLEMLGQAGCVSIEAGIESITEAGQTAAGKKLRVRFEEAVELLKAARKYIPFVQANLIDLGTDKADEVESWREKMQSEGIWANKPVPIFPYPGSGLYKQKWGIPDDFAWERAHEFYLCKYTELSDIQEKVPLSLKELELVADYAL